MFVQILSPDLEGACPRDSLDIHPHVGLSSVFTVDVLAGRCTTAVIMDLLSAAWRRELLVPAPRVRAIPGEGIVIVGAAVRGDEFETFAILFRELLGDGSASYHRGRCASFGTVSLVFRVHLGRERDNLGSEAEDLELLEQVLVKKEFALHNKGAPYVLAGVSVGHGKVADVGDGGFALGWDDIAVARLAPDEAVPVIIHDSTGDLLVLEHVDVISIVDEWVVLEPQASWN